MRLRVNNVVFEGRREGTCARERGEVRTTSSVVWGPGYGMRGKRGYHEGGRSTVMERRWYYEKDLDGMRE